MSRQQIQFPVQQVQIAKPPSPPSGSMRLYPKTDGKYYKLDSTGVEEQVGSTYVLPDPLTIGTIQVTSAFGVVGRSVMKMATGGVAAVASSEGQLEINNNSSGAAKIAFHREGSFAAYLGLDTDNVFRIGGWSHGGSAWRLLLGDGYTGNGDIRGKYLYSNDGANGVVQAGAGDLYVRSVGAGNAVRIDLGRLVVGSYDAGWPANFTGNPITSGRFYQQANGGLYCLDAGDMSSGVVGSKVVQRTPEGYINANYLNTTADVQGGRPVYVAGQNGDNYLRWWPASAIGPPAAAVGLGQAWGSPGPDSRVQVGAFQLDRVGYWVLVMVGRVNGGGGVAQYWMNVDGLGDVTYGDADSDSGNMYATIGAIYYYNGLLGPNNWIRTFVAKAGNTITGTTYAYFLPTQAYPN